MINFVKHLKLILLSLIYYNVTQYKVASFFLFM